MLAHIGKEQRENQGWLDYALVACMGDLGWLDYALMAETSG